eukprot:SAG22_NODE_1791_length_3568_cov_2.469876_1_plen_1083_part_10
MLLVVVLLLTLAPPAAVVSLVQQPPVISVAELQSSTVRPPTGGGTVWVLGSGFAPAVEVRLADGAGAAIPGLEAPLAIEQSVDDSLLLVNLGRKLPPQPLRLRLTRVGAGGVVLTALSPCVNAAEPHWVSPFVRPGGTAFLVGRRFWSSAETNVVLSAVDGPRRTFSAFVESDTRVTFAIQNVMPGEYNVSYQDDWASHNGTTGGAAADLVLTVLPPLANNGKVVDATAPPFSADPTGSTDATAALTAALIAAGQRGTATMSSGTYSLESPLPTASPACKNNAAAICLPAGLRVTLAGAGQSNTVIKLGPKFQAAIWGSGLSLRDLMLTDELAPGVVPAPPPIGRGTTPNHGLWSMDTYAAWGQNVSDVSFRRVRIVSTRNSATLMISYARRVLIDDSLLEGGGIRLEGPVYDVAIVNVTVRLHGPFPKLLGGGVEGAVSVGSRVSAVVLANSTFSALKPHNESTISGRLWQAMGSQSHLYIVGNYNLHAGPGGLDGNPNCGEQFLWENGVGDDGSVQAAAVNGVELTMQHLSENTLAKWLAKTSRSPLPKSIDPTGGMDARIWASEYGRGLGGVMIASGVGAGQSRRVVGLLQDNRTVLLDQEFGVPPDPASGLVLFHETTHSATIRDNTMIGIAEHVDLPAGQPGNVATTMVPLWGRADRVTFSGNTGKHLRTTLYSKVGGNLSVTDHLIRDTEVTHTRDGVALWNLPVRSRLSQIVSIENMNLSSVVGRAVYLMADCAQAPSCTGRPAGAVKISDFHATNVTVGLGFWWDQESGAGPAPHPMFANWSGSGLGAFSLREFSLSGSSEPASSFVEVYDELQNVALSSGSFSGFAKFSSGPGAGCIAGFKGPGCKRVANITAVPRVLTPLVLRPDGGGPWRVLVENVGLISGHFKVVQQDRGLSVSPSQWEMALASSPVVLTVSGDSGCASIASADDAATPAARFCVAHSKDVSVPRFTRQLLPPTISGVSGLTLQATIDTLDTPRVGGGSAWIHGADFCSQTQVSMVRDAGDDHPIPLLIDVLLKDGAGAIVSLPNPFPPGLWRFWVETASGSAISHVFNGPEPQWVSPVTGRPGESCSVLG